MIQTLELELNVARSRLEQIGHGALVPSGGENLLAVPLVVVGARCTVEPARVRRAEHDVLGHERDDLLTAAHPTRRSLRDASLGDDLAGERREVQLGAVPASGRAALRARLGRIARTIAGRIASVLRALPPSAVAGVAVAAAKPDLGVEHDDDEFVARRLVLGEELGLARLGLSDLREHQPTMHLPLVGVVAGVAAILLLAERDTALLALVARSPDVLVALGAGHHRRIADRHHAALASAPFLTDHDGGDVNPRTLEVQGLDHGTRRDVPARDREDLVRLVSVAHGFLRFVPVASFSRGREKLGHHQTISKNYS